MSSRLCLRGGVTVILGVAVDVALVVVLVMVLVAVLVVVLVVGVVAAATPWLSLPAARVWTPLLVPRPLQALTTLVLVEWQTFQRTTRSGLLQRRRRWRRWVALLRVCGRVVALICTVMGIDVATTTAHLGGGNERCTGSDGVLALPARGMPGVAVGAAHMLCCVVM